jgi:hypothetical protein
MTTDKYSLASPPEEPRLRELWLQHAAGFILMENVRQAAIDQLAPQLSAGERAVAIEAVDATMYQLMSVIDGVQGGLSNSQYQVDLHMIVQLRRRDANQTSVPEHMDLRDGDGMCMGIHGWLEGDYGACPIVES